MINQSRNAFRIAPDRRTELNRVIIHIFRPDLDRVVVDGAVKSRNDFTFPNFFIRKNATAKLLGSMNRDFLIIHRVYLSVGAFWSQ